MTGWKRTINIKDLIPNEESDEAAKRCAVALKELLEREFSDPDMDMTDIIWNLEDTQTVADVDSILEDLYDYGDEHRIWLGLKTPTPESQAAIDTLQDRRPS